MVSALQSLIEEGKECLDNAIYGHTGAKRKILQILAQNTHSTLVHKWYIYNLTL